jgi:beta-lactamase regulating signal transducer with metallopeptidase domain/Skp family chaperone for outer membrane proteins
MVDVLTHLLPWLLRTTVFLTVAWIIVWSLLRFFKLHSVRWQSLAWFAVLVQAVLVVPIGIEIPVRVALDIPAERKYHDDTTSFAYSNAGFVPSELASGTMNPQVAMPDFKFEISDSVGSTSSVPHLQNEPAGKITVPQILAGIWLTGVLVSVGWMFVSYALFLRRLATAEDCPSDWIAAWSTIQKSSNSVRHSIPVHVTGELGPAIFWRPGGCQLLIPRKRWSGLTDLQRECVMRHEFAHWQRGDLWRMVVFRLIASLQWFNPLAWSAVRRLEECAEWACDDFAQASHEADSPDYVRALLEFSIVPNCVPSPVPSASGHSLVRRARRLLSPAPRKDSTMKKLTLALITSAVIAAPAVTFKLVAEEPTKPAAQTSITQPSADEKPTTESTTTAIPPGAQSPATSPAQTDVNAPVLNVVTSEDSVALPPSVSEGISINVPALGPVPTLRDDQHISLTTGVTITRMPGVGGPGPGVLASTSTTQVKDVGAAIISELQTVDAPESAEARVQRLRAQGGTREAVIDMAHVFKNDPEFARMVTDMKRELELADAKLKLEAAHLAVAGKPPEVLTSEEAKNLQLELSKRRAELEVEIKMSRDRLVSKESEMYLAVYRRVRKAIAEHAQENGIHIVRRASMQSEQERQMNSGDPKTILQALNNEVVYVADDTLDITEEVIARLKSQSATAANPTPPAAADSVK